MAPSPSPGNPPDPLGLAGYWTELAGTGQQHLLHDLLTRLSEPWRHYHTQQHIADLLRLARQHAPLLAHPQRVDWAIWFHDAVYDPASRTNEAESATLARKALADLGMGDADIRQVNALIMATVDHSLPADADPQDAAAFLDFDLSILAAPRERYALYAQQVRKEFSRYPDLLYKPGRRKVLKGLLAKPHLFHTPSLRDLWELPARTNLEWEISI